jgi:methionyl-tRNA formyltransferase
MSKDSPPPSDQNNTNQRIVIFGACIGIAKVLAQIVENKLFLVCAVVPRVDRQTGLLQYSDDLSQTASKYGIPVITNTDINSTLFLNELRKISPDLLVNWGYAQIFKQELLEVPRIGVLNLHPGLLPAGRGSGAIVGEIWNSQKEIGQTIHFMDEHIDKGRIVHSRSFQISGYEYQDEINNRLQEGVVDFYITAIKKAISGEKGKKVEGFGRYYPKFIEGDDIIDWTQKSDFILRRIRSRSPYKNSRTFKNPERKEIYIRKSSLGDVDSYYSPAGQVIDRSESEGILVKTGDTAIWIEEISFNNHDFFKPAFSIGTSFVSNSLHELDVLHKKVESIIAEMGFVKSLLKSPDFDEKDLGPLFHCRKCGETSSKK